MVQVSIGFVLHSRMIFIGCLQPLLGIKSTFLSGRCIGIVAL